MAEFELPHTSKSCRNQVGGESHLGVFDDESFTMTRSIEPF